MSSYKGRNVIVVKPSTPTDEEILLRQNELDSKKEERTIRKKEFRLNKLLFSFNILLTLIALASFYFTYQQTKATVKSVELADKVFKAGQKQFQLSNAGYLEAKDFIVTTDIKKGIKISYSLTNQGKGTLQVLKHKGTLIIDNKHPSIKDLLAVLDDRDYIPISFFVSESESVSQKPDTPILSTSQVEDILRNLNTFYIIGETVYKDLITEKMVSYRYILSTEIVNDKEYEKLYTDYKNL